MLNAAVADACRDDGQLVAVAPPSKLAQLQHMHAVACFDTSVPFTILSSSQVGMPTCAFASDRNMVKQALASTRSSLAASTLLGFPTLRSADNMTHSCGTHMC